MTNKTAINISVDPKSVLALERAIMKILDCERDDKTARLALEVLGKGVHVANNTIADCSFDFRGSE